MKGDHIPTPNWLMNIFSDWFDPYPLLSNGPLIPPPKSKVWINPGFSQKDEAIENAILWHKLLGCTVVLYLPLETSTQYAKKLIQYGCKRLYFEKRPYPDCRAIEIIILTGDSE